MKSSLYYQKYYSQPNKENSRNQNDTQPSKISSTAPNIRIRTVTKILHIETSKIKKKKNSLEINKLLILIEMYFMNDNASYL